MVTKGLRCFSGDFGYSNEQTANVRYYFPLDMDFTKLHQNFSFNEIQSFSVICDVYSATFVFELPREVFRLSYEADYEHDESFETIKKPEGFPELIKSNGRNLAFWSQEKLQIFIKDDIFSFSDCQINSKPSYFWFDYHYLMSALLCEGNIIYVNYHKNKEIVKISEIQHGLRAVDGFSFVPCESFGVGKCLFPNSCYDEIKSGCSNSPPRIEKHLLLGCTKSATIVLCKEIETGFGQHTWVALRALKAKSSWSGEPIEVLFSSGFTPCLNGENIVYILKNGMATSADVWSFSASHLLQDRSKQKEKLTPLNFGSAW